MKHMPCTNCVQSDNPECTLRESKRGTYIRKRVRDSPLPEAALEPGPAETRPVDGAAAVAGDGLPHQESAPSGASLRSLSYAAAPQPCPTSCPVAGTPPSGPANPQRLSFSHDPAAPIESPFQQSSVGSEGNASSYRDISWSAMFDHFLNSRKDGREFIDKCSITYLGESFPLAMVLGDLNEGGRPRLHHPGPPFPPKDQQADAINPLQPDHMLPEDLDFLRIKGVFDLPDKLHLQTLLTVFLERVYPIYPIVNRQELIQQHANGSIPLILVHSICFIAATFCPLSVLHLVGFTSRRDARFFYYKKVKALFDSGYEINKIVILQSAMLMSFWGGGPNNYWNFYSWISTAVTIAETMGIHRSTATSTMQPQDKSLLRRLWWILVVRDSVCSALVGRPFRIDMEQSDTEMLTINDFTHDALVPEFLSDIRHQTYAQYQIEIARLSVILRDIVMNRFYPGRPRFGVERLHARLSRWREELPACLQWQDDAPDHLNPFSMTLSAQYDHHVILVYLGQSIGGSLSTSDDAEHADITDSAAQHISAIACAAVTRSSVLVMPHEFFHSIFLAQAVFYTKLKSHNKLIVQLGRSALTNCQMVLHESVECWDPSPWIMQLFDSLSTRQLEKPPPSTGYVSGPIDMSNLTGGLGSTPEAGVFNSLLSYDSWQSNPMLSSLFDLPLELSLPE
ncbi:fungal-specific transcription factor domain-containing protein [Aspergillus heterothallicus]